MENVGIFYGYLKICRCRFVYFMDIWKFSGNLVVICFLDFGTLCHEKSGNPASRQNIFVKSSNFTWDEIVT
jgi:hypothetical protein